MPAPLSLNTCSNIQIKKNLIRDSFFFCLCPHACSLPAASRGRGRGAHAANTPQVAAWDRPGRLVTVCSPSPASFICCGSGQNAISCGGGGRWWGWCGEGAWGMQRTSKASKKLSGTWVLPALRASLPALAHCVVRPDVSYGNTHTQTHTIHCVC